MMTTFNRRDWAVAVGGDCMHVSVSVCLRLQLYSIMREVNKQNYFTSYENVCIYITQNWGRRLKRLATLQKVACG